MDADDMLALGLGISPPWKLVAQRLDTGKRPKELHIELAAERSAASPSQPQTVTQAGSSAIRSPERKTLLWRFSGPRWHRE